MMNQPLISAIMLTRDRASWIPRAIRLWQEQTYPNVELIVKDSGEPIEHLLPHDPRIRYFRGDAQRDTFGVRVNQACERAQGEFLAIWDDDDWYHPRRIEEQLAILGDKQVTGYHSIIFHGDYGTFERVHTPAHGNSLLFRREYWQQYPWRAMSVGCDWAFAIDAKHRRKLIASDGRERCVASIHQGNTWQRTTTGWISAQLPPEYIAP